MKWSVSMFVLDYQLGSIQLILFLTDELSKSRSLHTFSRHRILIFRLRYYFLSFPMHLKEVIYE